MALVVQSRAIVTDYFFRHNRSRVDNNTLKSWTHLKQWNKWPLINLMSLHFAPIVMPLLIPRKSVPNFMGLGICIGISNVYLQAKKYPRNIFISKWYVTWPGTHAVATYSYKSKFWSQKGQTIYFLIEINFAFKKGLELMTPQWIHNSGHILLGTYLTICASCIGIYLHNK